MKLRANVVEQKIFEIEDLKELEEFLQSQSEIEQLRERLFAEFLKYADYKNAGEWNKAVRLCESLAIIGWGNHEPVEALRGQFFNGNPATCFQNKFGETRCRCHLVEKSQRFYYGAGKDKLLFQS